MTRNEEHLRPQYKRILAYLRRHGKITPAQAFHDLGISKLSTRIGELIALGYPIVKIPTEGYNRFNEKVRYMTYYLKDGEEAC